MNKLKLILPVLLICAFLDYMVEFHEEDVKMTFRYNTRTLASQWYWTFLYKDIRSVILAWYIWYLIPRKEIILRAGAAIFCTMVTTVPIYFILYYSAPYSNIVLGIKLAASIFVGYMLYLNDRNCSRSDSNGNN